MISVCHWTVISATALVHLCTFPLLGLNCGFSLGLSTDGMLEINNNGTEQPGGTSGMETTRTLKHFPPYGTMNDNLTTDCPTCRGIGRIPRG